MNKEYSFYLDTLHILDVKLLSCLYHERE